MRTLLTKLRQTNNICLGVSLGVHLLLLGVALPRFTTALPAEMTGDESKGDRFVGVVELNSVDVTRLPFYPSSVNVIQTPNPSFSSPNSVTPESKNNNQQQYQSLFPNLPAIPLPTPVSIPQPPSINNSTFLSPPPPPPVVFNQQESVIIPPPIDTTPSKPILEAPLLAKKPKPSHSPTNILAEQEDNLIVAARLRADSLKYDSTNTSNEEATRNYSNWLVAVDAKETTDLTITGTYPQDACIKQLEGTSVYGVKLSKDGRVTDAELIQSSGYVLLNQQALENINSATWINSIESGKSYRISVNFKYDSAICPSLTVPQLSTVETLIETPKIEEETPTNTLENSVTTPE